MGSKLTLRGDGGTASGYTVELDGYDLSRSCRSLKLEMDVGDANVATFEVYVDRIEADADVEAVLVDVTPSRERTSFASKFREWVAR